MKRETSVRAVGHDEQKILSSAYDDEIQRTLRVMSVLNKDYTAIYFVNLDTDSYTSYLNTGTPNESALEIVQARGVYTEAMAQCIQMLVVEEDREWLAGMTDRRTLMERLEKEYHCGYRNVCKWIFQIRGCPWNHCHTDNSGTGSLFLCTVPERSKIREKRFFWKKLQKSVDSAVGK